MILLLYIVQCRDKKTLYTGITTDISRRLNEHNTKKGAFYTQNKTPVKLVYQQAMAGQSEACKREAAIKKLTRQEKLELIKLASTFGRGRKGMFTRAIGQAFVTGYKLTCIA